VNLGLQLLVLVVLVGSLAAEFANLFEAAVADSEK